MHILESVSWSKVIYLVANKLLLDNSSSSYVAMTILLLVSLHELIEKIKANEYVSVCVCVCSYLSCVHP